MIVDALVELLVGLLAWAFEFVAGLLVWLFEFLVGLAMDLFGGLIEYIVELASTLPGKLLDMAIGVAVEFPIVSGAIVFLALVLIRERTDIGSNIDLDPDLDLSDGTTVVAMAGLGGFAAGFLIGPIEAIQLALTLLVGGG